MAPAMPDIPRTALPSGLAPRQIVTGLWQLADKERDGAGAPDPDRAAAALAGYARDGFDTWDMAWAYLLRGMSAVGPCPMTRVRRIWARFLTLWHPAVLAGLMLILFSVYFVYVEPRRAGTSGRDAALAIAPHIPAGSVVLAKDLVEARPETLWYVAQAVAANDPSGPSVVIRWEPYDVPDARPGTLLFLRTDDMSREAQVVQERGWPRIEPVVSVRVHKYDATLYRVVERVIPE